MLCYLIQILFCYAWHRGLFSYLFHFLIDVLICCQAAMADIITGLGSNVTINCDLDENDVSRFHTYIY